MHFCAQTPTTPRYGRDVDRLVDDGALPHGWVSPEVGPPDAAARMAFLWRRMHDAVVAAEGEFVHRKLIALFCAVPFALHH